jgi:ubiquinone/menaquinone biosynthesis C-methylase UbiE
MAIVCTQFDRFMKVRVKAMIISQLGWGWFPSALFQFRRRIRNRLWSSNPGRFCVDICCGTGLTSIEKAVQWPSTNFYCIDVNKAELVKGQALSLALGIKNITFIHGDAYNLPFKEGTVNTIIVANILRDLRDIKATILAWSKVMNRQSTMIIETPIAPQKHILFKSKAIKNFVKHQVDPDHGFVEGELENFLKFIDFKPIQRLPAFNGSGVLAKECHYILTAVHPVLPAIFWLPLYIMMIIGQAPDRGNALTLIAERG